MASVPQRLALPGSGGQASPPPTGPLVPSYVHTVLSAQETGWGAVTLVSRSPWPGRLSHGEQGISCSR